MTRRNEPSTLTKFGRRDGWKYDCRGSRPAFCTSGWCVHHHHFTPRAFTPGFLLMPLVQPTVKSQTRFFPHLIGVAGTRIRPGRVRSAVKAITVLFSRSSVDLFPLHSRRSKPRELTRGQTMTAFAPFALAACALCAALYFPTAARNGLLPLISTGRNACAAPSAGARRFSGPAFRWSMNARPGAFRQVNPFRRYTPV